MELSGQSFELDCFSKLLDICDCNIVNHSYCGSTKLTLPSSYLFVQYSVWVVLSKHDGVEVLGVLFSDKSMGGVASLEWECFGYCWFMDVCGNVHEEKFVGENFFVFSSVFGGNLCCCCCER